MCGVFPLAVYVVRGSLLVLYRFSGDDFLVPIGQSCGKPVGISTLAELQLASQFGYARREVAHCEIGLCCFGTESAKFLLGKRSAALHLENSAGEI